MRGGHAAGGGGRVREQQRADGVLQVQLPGPRPQPLADPARLKNTDRGAGGEAFGVCGGAAQH
eukprot:2639831-Rhodomonas_salina.1